MQLARFATTLKSSHTIYETGHAVLSVEPSGIHTKYNILMKVLQRSLSVFVYIVICPRNDKYLLGI
ncbi:hypothetical protein PBCV1_a538L [Paramecium bursaria Chlorella virus 1]|uniref:Uncharacterized protein n=1 Tax=Paramecium bursaria Chlorella virus 1 TaxID=10506 RepID=Q98586_PBCV1|nr:hypothetical protein PBCV1_a538L [Paramecium bursaria Chlorella virus 1]AAC96905.1 hypothetical protein [Paramecium bursaria Chlorella virus 1]